MKSSEPSSPYFSKEKEAGQNSSNKEEKSPYLKSVLSGSFDKNNRVIRLTISDRLAAIRYIQESQWRHNFFRG